MKSKGYEKTNDYAGICHAYAQSYQNICPGATSSLSKINSNNYSNTPTEHSEGSYNNNEFAEADTVAMLMCSTGF